MSCVVNEPLSPTDAKAAIRRILSEGVLAYSGHARREMSSDEYGPISELDVTNVLRGGVPRPAELENGTWRYRFETSRFVVVVAFRDELRAVVVTAWRIKP
jgi:hypothetical protein